VRAAARAARIWRDAPRGSMMPRSSSMPRVAAQVHYAAMRLPRFFADAHAIAAAYAILPPF
jgi:hypothetical protein